MPTPVRKRTPTACKTWKENLRRACLDRARRRRSHPRQSPDANHNNGNNNNNMDDADGRAMVEEELRQQGISVISPCMDRSNNNSNNNNIDQMRAYDSPSRDLDLEGYGYSQNINRQQVDVDSATSATSEPNNEPNVNHFISEEELFELLEQVEEEIQRTDALRLEEVLQLADNEQTMLEEQVRDFEEWQATEQSLSEHVQQSSVLCPVCREANLSETMQGGIICPNHMDGSCPLELTPTATTVNAHHNDHGHGQQYDHGQQYGQHGLTLHHLCEQLRMAYEEHASYCQDYLSFEVTTSTTSDANVDRMEHEHGHENSLVAVCPTCETRMQLLV